MRWGVPAPALDTKSTLCRGASSSARSYRARVSPAARSGSGRAARKLERVADVGPAAPADRRVSRQDLDLAACDLGTLAKQADVLSGRKPVGRAAVQIDAPLRDEADAPGAIGDAVLRRGRASF